MRLCFASVLKMCGVMCCACAAPGAIVEYARSCTELRPKEKYRASGAEFFHSGIYLLY